jgi:hypothetical protein
LFDTSIEAIEKAYTDLGHTLGWRFLTGPRSTLSGGADVAFITLNPGGTSEPADHPRASCENGNAYLTETWSGHAPGAAPLQQQVQMLLTQLKDNLGYRKSLEEFLDTEVVSGYFIPFRSPSIGALPFRKESLRFARRLWEVIFAAWMPRLILTIDNDGFREIAGILKARPKVSVVEARKFPTGWGEYQADTLRLSGLRGDGALTIARLPHLSRFQLFGSPTRAPYLANFLAYLAEGMANTSPKEAKTMDACARILEAAKFLQANGFTERQLSSIHHFSLKGRKETYAAALRYFGEQRELRDRNLAYANRLEFIANQYRAKAGSLNDLIKIALQRWPLY